MNAQNSDNRTLINLDEQGRKCEGLACAARYTLEPFVPFVFPEPTSARVFFNFCHAQVPPLPVEYFEPKQHMDRVRDWRRTHPIGGQVEVYPSEAALGIGNDPEAVAVMMQIGGQKIMKPTWMQVKNAQRTTLQSWLLLLGKPTIHPESGRELSMPAMQKLLCELLDIREDALGGAGAPPSPSPPSPTAAEDGQ